MALPSHDATRRISGLAFESINSEWMPRRGTSRGVLAPWPREMAGAPRW
jgi:hypothetical protein